MWVARLGTPAFVVDAYLNRDRKLILCVDKESVASALIFAKKACAVVGLDGHERTQEFLNAVERPVFTGPDAVLWAVREALI